MGLEGQEKPCIHFWPGEEAAGFLAKQGYYNCMCKACLWGPETCAPFVSLQVTARRGGLPQLHICQQEGPGPSPASRQGTLGMVRGTVTVTETLAVGSIKTEDIAVSEAMLSSCI